MAEISITPKKYNVKNMPTVYEKQKTDFRERKRTILYLIHSYLMEQNFYTSAEALSNEAQLNGLYQVCENVDLDIILQEYQSYYNTKFQKYPKIVRKLDSLPKESSQNMRRKSLPKISKQETKEINESHLEHEKFQFEITSLSNYNNKKTSDEGIDIEVNFTPEWKEMADVITKEFVQKDISTTWSDCIGLATVAEKLKEAITYPVLYPELFQGIHTWKGILLFGPPGTGKTLLAKALTAECCTFINVTSSTFVSKWRGESEKMVKVLFDLAKKYAPTTIFIDEVDALMSTTSQHEASRRFKSELLTQIDGVKSRNEHVFILGSTNVPWNLDTAMLRRFEKRIFVPLPDATMKISMLKHYINTPNSLEEKEWAKLSEMTENFSGSDIKSLSAEVKMKVIREKIKEINVKGANRVDKNLRKIAFEDVTDSLKKVRSCVIESDIHKFQEWNDKFGSY